MPRVCVQQKAKNCAFGAKQLEKILQQQQKIILKNEFMFYVITVHDTTISKGRTSYFTSIRCRVAFGLSTLKRLMRPPVAGANRYPLALLRLEFLI